MVTLKIGIDAGAAKGAAETFRRSAADIQRNARKIEGSADTGS
jgi:hypothetical protein